MVRALLLFDFLSSLSFFCPRVELSFVSTVVYGSCPTFFVCCYIRGHMSLRRPVSLAWPIT